MKFSVRISFTILYCLYIYLFAGDPRPRRPEDGGAEHHLRRPGTAQEGAEFEHF